MNPKATARYQRPSGMTRTGKESVTPLSYSVLSPERLAIGCRMRPAGNVVSFQYRKLGVSSSGRLKTRTLIFEKYAFAGRATGTPAALEPASFCCTRGGSRGGAAQNRLYSESFFPETACCLWLPHPAVCLVRMKQWTQFRGRAEGASTEARRMVTRSPVPVSVITFSRATDPPRLSTAVFTMESPRPEPYVAFPGTR